MANGDYRLALLVLAPFIGSIVSYLVGRFVPVLAGYVATAAVGVAFSSAVALWGGVSAGGTFTMSLSPWISFDGVSLPLELYFDALSATMSLIVTGVGFLIHLYSIGYMAEDESGGRFFAYLNLFVASMMVLVLGRSLPVVFIGWEGVGLCSYLLIGFWYSNPDYASAGRKAFVMNRIGDLGFLVAMAILFTWCETLDIRELSRAEVLAKLPADLGFVAGLALFLAATGKSAQIPLFTWLPDAMAGPTPVSALIHAATMVTAGIYLMARMNGVIEIDPAVPAVILWTALATSAVAGLTAVAQNDIKKVLAYSTVSQLGFMFIAVGLGQYAVALFHVVTHAFFKACLFLSAGSVIHSCHHEQDMRHMGGLARKMPLTCAAYACSTLAIAGVYPFAGYFSKHAILGAIPGATNPLLVAYLPLISKVALAIAICTAFYMTRSFVLTFLGQYRGHAHPHEAPAVMTAPVLVLGILSVGGGLYLDHRLPEFLQGVLPHVLTHHEAAGFGDVLKGSLAGLAGIAAALALFRFSPETKEFMRSLTKPLEVLFARKFFVDEILDAVVVRPLGAVSRILFKAVDQTIVTGSGDAIGMVSRAVGEMTCRVTTGQVTTYLLYMFLAAGVFLALFVQLR
jgi:NADH-quinone oxidoreductase subunit L